MSTLGFFGDPALRTPAYSKPSSLILSLLSESSSESGTVDVAAALFTAFLPLPPSLLNTDDPWYKEIPRIQIVLIHND